MSYSYNFGWLGLGGACFLGAFALSTASCDHQASSPTDLSDAVLVYYDEDSRECIAAVARTAQSDVTILQCAAARERTQIPRYMDGGSTVADLADELRFTDPWENIL